MGDLLWTHEVGVCLVGMRYVACSATQSNYKDGGGGAFPVDDGNLGLRFVFILG